jgi:hypothetical protein
VQLEASPSREPCPLPNLDHVRGVLWYTCRQVNSRFTVNPETPRSSNQSWPPCLLPEFIQINLLAKLLNLVKAVSLLFIWTSTTLQRPNLRFFARPKVTPRCKSSEGRQNAHSRIHKVWHDPCNLYSFTPPSSTARPTYRALAYRERRSTVLQEH